MNFHSLHSVLYRRRSQSKLIVESWMLPPPWSDKSNTDTQNFRVASEQCRCVLCEMREFEIRMLVCPKAYKDNRIPRMGYTPLTGENIINKTNGTWFDESGHRRRGFPFCIQSNGNLRRKSYFEPWCFDGNARVAWIMSIQKSCKIPLAILTMTQFDCIMPSHRHHLSRDTANIQRSSIENLYKMRFVESEITATEQNIPNTKSHQIPNVFPCLSLYRNSAAMCGRLRNNNQMKILWYFFVFALSRFIPFTTFSNRWFCALCAWLHHH